jgi:hypothetical protein
MSVTINQLTQHYIPEDLNLNLHLCENVKCLYENFVHIVVYCIVW